MARDQINSSQQRLIKVILALFADVVQGVAPGQLAQAAGCSAPDITRDMKNLIHAGLAEKVEETGRYRLTPRLPQQSIKVWTAIDRAERELQEARSRFNRISN